MSRAFHSAHCFGFVALGRQSGQPISLVSALNAIAALYGQMKVFDKGFEAIDEAWLIAENLRDLVPSKERGCCRENDDAALRLRKRKVAYP